MTQAQQNTPAPSRMADAGSDPAKCNVARQQEPKKADPPTPAFAIQCAMQAFNFRADEYHHNRRWITAVFTRTMAAAALRDHYSLNHIGNCFGGKDHTTILNNLEVHSRLLQTNAIYIEAWQRMQDLMARREPRPLSWLRDFEGPCQFIQLNSGMRGEGTAYMMEGCLRIKSSGKRFRLIYYAKPL